MLFFMIYTCEVMYRTLPVNLNNALLSVYQTACIMRAQKSTRTHLKAMSVSVVGAKLWNELDSNL